MMLETNVKRIMIVVHIDDEEDEKTIEKSVNSLCLWASFHLLIPFSVISVK
jgi:uncharacterized protein YqgV (UPF0045/DUF77 family)